MQKQGEVFSIIYNGEAVNVQPYLHLGRTVYAVGLKPKPMVIIKTEKITGKELWTSLPQGEQKLAEIIGALIDDKLESKQQTLF